MKRFVIWFSGVSNSLALLAVETWLFCLSSINFRFTEMRYSFLLLAFYVVVVYTVDFVMMQKGSSLSLFVVFQVIAVVGACFLFPNSVKLEPFQSRPVVIHCIIYCVILLGAGFIAYEPTNNEGLTICFDILSALIIILLFLDQVLQLPLCKNTSIFCVISILLILISLVVERTERYAFSRGPTIGSKTGGRLLLIGCSLLIAALGAILLILLGDAAGNFTAFCFRLFKQIGLWVLNGLKYLYGLFERFMIWLSGFFKDQPSEAIGGMPAEGQADYVMEEVSVAFPAWFTYVLIGIVAAAVAFLIFKLRKQRFNRIAAASYHQVTKTSRESGFKKQLQLLFNRFKRFLVFRYNCFHYRRSAPGLLCFCESKAGKNNRRCTGESGQMYLRRLASLANDDDSRQALIELSSLVQHEFYSGSRSDVPMLLVKKIRKIRFRSE